MYPPEEIPLVSISIVSHGQGNLAAMALSDLARIGDSARVEVVLTLNIPEQLPFSIEDFPYSLTIIKNDVAKGFGANHNAAFRGMTCKWFCVLNPDVRLPSNPFAVLVNEIERYQAAVIAPAALSPTGQLEDSIRRFPTPFSLTKKMLGQADGRYSFAVGDETFAADWVGGMFMLFRAEDYRRVGGFDEGFFLYYEDVDICARLWRAGCRVMATPKAQVIHDARRASRRNVRYMWWHAASIARYLGKYWLRLPSSMGS